MNSIPAWLWRGDSDPKGERMLMATFGQGAVITNLANGGVGNVIHRIPLPDLVATHIGAKHLFPKSHFLSFSTDRSLALGYACYQQPKLQVLGPNSPRDSWKAILMGIDTSLLDITPTSLKGVFLCKYQASGISKWRDPQEVVLNSVLHNSLASRGFPKTVTFALIDPLVAMSDCNVESLAEAIHNAHRDKEWLILPLDPMNDRSGEFTASLEDDLFASVEKYG